MVLSSGDFSLLRGSRLSIARPEHAWGNVLPLSAVAADTEERTRSVRYLLSSQSVTSSIDTHLSIHLKCALAGQAIEMRNSSLAPIYDRKSPMVAIAMDGNQPDVLLPELCGGTGVSL